MTEVASQAPEVEKTEHLVVGTRLMTPWVVLNAVGLALGLAAWGGINRAVMEPFYGAGYLSAIEAARIQATGNGAAMAAFGAILGTAQWLVLRQVLRAGWWVPATLAGWTFLGIVLGFSAGGSTSTIGPAGGPLPGLVAIVIVPLVFVLVGVGQWLILRREATGAEGWLVVNVGSLVAAGLLGLLAAKLLPWIAGTSYPSARALAVAGLVGGPLYGWLTWQFLAGLRRRAA